MHFTTVEQLINLADSSGLKISEIMIKQEAALKEADPKVIYQAMSNHLKVMEEAIERGMTEDLKSRSGLAGGDAKLLSYYKNRHPLSGKLTIDAMTMSLATAELNACMGAIVAVPTAGSCGVVPGCIFAVGSHLNSDRNDLIHALFTAGAFGLIIANNASISGAAGGCQAEVGSAAGMAAAAAVQLAGGSPNQCAHAAAIALKSILGLVCDPVAGLVEVPCIKRNAIGAAIAIASADMALAGIESAIPCDEVIDAMHRVGRLLPTSLKETSMDGLATTETGKKIEKVVLGNL